MQNQYEQEYRINATNKTVTWSSSDISKVTVDNTGLIEAIAAGSATITATANDGSGVSGSLAVTAEVPVSIELANVYKMNSNGSDLDVVAMKNMGNGIWRMAVRCLTSGKYPTYKLSTDYTGTANWGEENAYYLRKGYDDYVEGTHGSNIANYDSITLAFFNKYNTAMANIDGKGIGLYLFDNTEFGKTNALSTYVGTSLASNDEYVEAFSSSKTGNGDSIWTAANKGTTGIVIISPSSFNFSSTYPHYSGIITPWFYLDTRKVNISATNEITLKS